MSDKNKVRKRVKETLSNLSKPLYEAYSKRIADTLFNDNDWKTARVIGIYISNPPEVDTYQIIRKAWEQGKQVVSLNAGRQINNYPLEHCLILHS